MESLIYNMVMDVLDKKSTTSISVKIRNLMWLDQKREEDPKFTFSKFVDDAISKAREEEGGS
jgi:hypothetical protein